ncbi:DinB family protein [Microlunatus aurantiacus]|uniref:DinB family protein n=1 Tax=Microlunatus aurantiacus TaxID=446786 RepID=A0ABP7E1K8_9ACTN
MAGASVDRVTDITPTLKDTLQRYLRKERSALLATLDGLEERQIRWPFTPTGTNLLGLVKHTASVSLGYFGETFGRDHGQALPWFDDDARENDDLWATAGETREQIVSLYEASAREADATIAALDLDSPGRVPWWGEHGDVTLGRILVHMIAETAHHAGHADIVREMLLGTAPDADPNLPGWDAGQWAAYRSGLEEIAASAGA